MCRMAMVHFNVIHLYNCKQVLTSRVYATCLVRNVRELKYSKQEEREDVTLPHIFFEELVDYKIICSNELEYAPQQIILLYKLN